MRANSEMWSLFRRYAQFCIVGGSGVVVDIVWTFRGLGVKPSRCLARVIRFGKFNLICVAGIALSVLLLNVQASWLDGNVYLANLNSIVVVSVWNFFMNLKFGWKNAAA